MDVIVPVSVFKRERSRVCVQQGARKKTERRKGKVEVEKKRPKNVHANRKAYPTVMTKPLQNENFFLHGAGSIFKFKESSLFLIIQAPVLRTQSVQYIQVIIKRTIVNYNLYVQTACTSLSAKRK